MREPIYFGVPSESDPQAAMLVHAMQLPSGRVLLQLTMHSIGDEGPDDERNAMVELSIERLGALIVELSRARAWMARVEGRRGQWGS